MASVCPLVVGMTLSSISCDGEEMRKPPRRFRVSHVRRLEKSSACCRCPARAGTTLELSPAAKARPLKGVIVKAGDNG